MKNNIQVMRLSEVLDMTKLSKTTLWNRTQAGLFPESFKLGGKSAGFFKHEVEATLTAMGAGVSEVQLRALVSDLAKERKARAGELFNKLVA